jgi:hypothetical protein
VLVKGFPVFGSGETPLVLTGPQALATCPGTDESLVASECPLAPAEVAGTNMAKEANAVTAKRPAGSRILFRTVLVSGKRTPRMPT